MREDGEDKTVLEDRSDGDARDIEQLIPSIYRELRRLAQTHLTRGTPGHSIQATELVHEAYLRLIGPRDVSYQSDRHFFFAASRAMRDILVERARRKLRLKRGGDRHRVDLANLVVAADTEPAGLLALDEALCELQRDDPQKHQIVLLRFFGGLTTAQIAAAIGLSARTVDRQWQYIRAKLHRELAEFT